MPAPPSVEGTPSTSSQAALSGPAPAWRRGLILLGAVLLFWAIAVIFQALGGAYRSELSGYPDEPAHYVTALMIRDYLTSGQWAHPIAFAENYYLHYPKVAFGMWGPGLHVLGASW